MFAEKSFATMQISPNGQPVKWSSTIKITLFSPCKYNVYKGLLWFIVHYTDEISNRQFIIDIAKVVDFIEEMSDLIMSF